jgi:hypothetical protein
MRIKESFCSGGSESHVKIGSRNRALGEDLVNFSFLALS